MAEQLDLKALERKVWRSYHDDGLLDLFLGLLLLGLGVVAWISLRGIPERLTLVADIVWAIPALLVFWAGKRYVTVPRLGIVKFGAERQAKRAKTSVVLTVSLLLGVAVFVTLLVRPELLGGPMLIPTVFAVNALVVFGFAAYFLDLPRLVVYGLLFGLPVPVSAILRQELALRQAPALLFVAASVVILVIGMRFFVRFLRTYPLPNERELHGNG